MSGMFYLPRLFVYHCETTPGAPDYERFVTMERKLLKIIMNPAVIAVWVFGLTLAWTMDYWRDGWFDAKLVLVLGMTLTHHIYARWAKEFAERRNTRTARFFRIWNEVPDPADDRHCHSGHRQAFLTIWNAKSAGGPVCKPPISGYKGASSPLKPASGTRRSSATAEIGRDRPRADRFYPHHRSRKTAKSGTCGPTPR